MKKILLTIGLMATASAVFAQGYVNFSPGTMIVQTNTSGSALFGGTGTGGTSGSMADVTIGDFEYALLIQHYAGSAPTDTSVWDGTWSSTITSSNSSVAGRVLAEGTGVNVGSLYGWNAFGNGGSTFPNGTNGIVLVGWSVNLGTSWSQVSGELAYAAANNNTFTNTSTSTLFFGESTFGWENASLAAPGIALFGAAANAGGQPIVIASGMSLYALPVPEPATFALFGLGGLAMLAIRRRK